MKTIAFILMMIFFSISSPTIFSQSKKNTEINDLKEQIRALEGKNRNLEIKILNLEKQVELLQNNLSWILSILNSRTSEDRGQIYTIKFNKISEELFVALAHTVNSLNMKHFEYMETETYIFHYNKWVREYSGEIGIFNSYEEAVKFKSNLPKGILYTIVRLNE